MHSITAWFGRGASAIAELHPALVLLLAATTLWVGSLTLAAMASTAKPPALYCRPQDPEVISVFMTLDFTLDCWSPRTAEETVLVCADGARRLYRPPCGRGPSANDLRDAPPVGCSGRGRPDRRQAAAGPLQHPARALARVYGVEGRVRACATRPPPAFTLIGVPAFRRCSANAVMIPL